MQNHVLEIDILQTPIFIQLSRLDDFSQSDYL